MRLITSHRGELQMLSPLMPEEKTPRGVVTGFDAWDVLAPAGRFAAGCIHELLSDPGGGRPLFVASLLARACAARRAGIIVWCDPQHWLYPPALAAGGMDLDRLLLLKPESPDEAIWSLAESLRCRGVAAVVGGADRLSRLQARRLQLAAERGGGIGILLRQWTTACHEHAAATRWYVRRIPGERTLQRWELQLIHGHGGRIGQSVILEVCRETHRVRVSDPVADRSMEPSRKRA